MRIEKVLTQHELTIDLSLPALQYIVEAMVRPNHPAVGYSVSMELSNFRNTLLNLIERGVDKTPEAMPVLRPDDNSDLI
jgi:hypothetical protein